MANTFQLTWTNSPAFETFDSVLVESAVGEDVSWTFSQDSGTTDVSAWTIQFDVAPSDNRNPVFTIPNASITKSIGGNISFPTLKAKTETLPPRSYYWELIRTDLNSRKVLSFGNWKLVGSPSLFPGVTVPPTIIPTNKGGTGSDLSDDGPSVIVQLALGANLTALPADLSNTVLFLRKDLTWQTPSGAGIGTVTSVSVVTANGVSGSVATATSTPAITISLGAITPTSVAATGNVTGTNLSGTNTGDQTNISGNAATVSVIDAGADTTCWPLVGNSQTGNLSPATNSAYTFNATTGTLSATAFAGALAGNASTATLATNATNSAITNDTTTNATTYPTWVTTTTGNLPQKVSSTKFTFNPSTGNVTATTFTGALVGNADTATLAGTVSTNANLTGDVTSVGNATTLTNAPVIAKVLTGYASGAGTVAATDSILQAIQKLNGNDATNANLTGPVTSVGNATSIASQTGTGTTFAMSAGPTFTGVPAAPTASPGTNTTQLATTAFVAAAVTAGIPTAITVANEASDTTCFPLFATAATGDLGPKSNASLTFNSSTANLGCTTFTGALVGNATTATALANVRTIGGSNFDGSGNVTSFPTPGAIGGSTPAAGTFTALTGTSGSITGLTALAIRDTSAAFDLTIAGTSSTTFTAGRTLTLDLVNAARTLKISGNPTIADWFDQSVKTGASPTFVTVTAALTGNATTATTLATSRNLWGQAFTGAADVTGSLTSVADITGGASSMTITAGTGASRTLVFKTTTSGSTATTALTLAADQSATFANTVNATTFVGALTGTASGNLVAGGALGTPSSGTLTNCTFPTLNQNTTGSAASLSISGQTGLLTVTGLASTSRIKTVRDAADTILELGGSYTPTGTWTSLTLVTPALGTPASGVVTNLTGTASININGTVGATTPAAGTFTTLVAGSTTSLLLGTAGSAVGNIGFRNATSGTITLAPPNGALGTVAVTLPNAASTLPIFGQQITFAGPTAARTYTLPDADTTLGAASTGANPSASVGLAAVNGSASTFLRSDGAPALSQAIAPTWTGVHTFTPAVRTSGSAAYLTINAPADTTLAASTEAIGINHVGATRQFATGALTTQREYVFGSPTYSFVGASNITTAVTMSVAAPAMGTNATVLGFNIAGDFSVASSGGGAALAIRGVSTATSGNSTGGRFEATGATSATNIAVRGVANSGTANVGFYTDVTSGASNYAFQSAGSAISLFAADIQITTVGTGSTSAVTCGGTQTLTNKTLTAPKFASGGFIADANGNEQIIFTTTTSAVNEITVTNAASGSGPIIAASGGDSSVDIKVRPKGTFGNVYLANAQNVIVNESAVATSDPRGFLYIPSCAGTPTGSADSFSNHVPLFYDSTNDILYIYRSGWKKAVASLITGAITWQ